MVYHDFLPSFKNARINLSASKAMPRIGCGQTNKKAGVMVRFLRASMASGCGISQVAWSGFFARRFQSDGVIFRPFYFCDRFQ
jgi:hypothetical protein